MKLARIYKMESPEQVNLSVYSVFKVLRNELICAVMELEVDEALLNVTDEFDEEFDGEGGAEDQEKDHGKTG